MLASGFNVFDLDFRVKIDSVEQPVKGHSVGSRSVSHRWTFAFDDNLDSCFVFLKNGQQCTAVRKLYVRIDVINLLPIPLFRRREAFLLRSSIGMFLKL